MGALRFSERENSGGLGGLAGTPEGSQNRHPFSWLIGGGVLLVLSVNILFLSPNALANPSRSPRNSVEKGRAW